MDTASREAELRKALVAASIDLVRTGLNQGTAGNISARLGTGMLITPSGIPPEKTTPRMIAAMNLDGDGLGSLRRCWRSQPGCNQAPRGSSMHFVEDPEVTCRGCWGVPHSAAREYSQ